MSVGLQGLSVSDFKVSERPTFETGTFVTSEKFVVRPRLLPLLKKQIVIREIRLVKPRISLVRDAAGQKFNFSDLLVQARPLPPVAAAVDIAPSTPTAPAELNVTIGRVLIEQGQVDFIDHSTAAWSTTITELNLRVDDIHPDRAAQIQSDFRAGLRGLDSKIAVTASLAWPKKLDIQSLSLESGPSKLQLSGGATNLTTSPQFDLTTTIQSLDTGVLKKFVSLPTDLTLSGAATGRLAAKGTQDQLIYSVALLLDQVAVASGKSFSKPAGVPLSLAAAGSLIKADTLLADQLKLTLGDLIASGQAEVRDLGKEVQRISAQLTTNDFAAANLLQRFPSASLPENVKLNGPMQANLNLNGTLEKFKVTFDAGLGRIRVKGDGDVNNGKILTYVFNVISENISLADVASVVPMLKDYAPTGKASLKARVTSDAMPVSGTLTLTNANVRYQKSELTQFTGPVQFTTKDISAPRLTGKLNGSDLSGSFKVRALDVHPAIESHIVVQSLDLERLMPAPSPVPTQKTRRSLFVESAWAAPTPAGKKPSLPMDLKGSLKTETVKHPFLTATKLALTWNVTDVTADLGKLGGSATLRQGEGRVTNIQQFVNESKAAKVLLLPMTILQKLNKATGGTMKLPSLDQVNYNLVTGDYSFQSGVMTVSKFILSGTELDADLSGTAQLAGEQRLGMKSTVRLAAGLVGGTAGEWLQDEDGRVTMPLTIKGTISDPKISMDARSTGKKILESIQNDPDKMKDVEKLLKGIFK